MIRSILCVAFAAILIVQTGCRAYQLQGDQDRIRNSVLEMHTNQVMDNLIRLQQGLPVVQLEYIHMTGTITQNASGNFSGAPTHVTEKVNGPAGALVTFTKTVTHAFTYGATADQSNQLTITAEPVYENAIYDAYLEFLKKDGHLMTTMEPPGPNEAIVVKCTEAECRECDWLGRPKTQVTYHWIPSGYVEDFRNLCLAVVVKRNEAVESPVFFDGKVVSFDIPPECATADVKTKLKLKKEQRQCEELYIWEIGTYKVDVILNLDKEIPDVPGHICLVINGLAIRDEKALEILSSIKKSTAGEDKPDVKQITVRVDLNRVKLLDIEEWNKPIEKSEDEDEKKVAAKETEKQRKLIHDAFDSFREAIVEKPVELHLYNKRPGEARRQSGTEGVRTQLELQRLNQLR